MFEFIFLNFIVLNISCPILEHGDIINIFFKISIFTVYLKTTDCNELKFSGWIILNKVKPSEQPPVIMVFKQLFKNFSWKNTYFYS